MLVISWHVHVCVWSNLDRSVGNLSLIAVLWFSLKSYLFIASCLSLLSKEKVHLRRALGTNYNWLYLWKDAFYTCYCQKLLFNFPGAITRWKSDGVFQQISNYGICNRTATSSGCCLWYSNAVPYQSVVCPRCQKPKAGK